MKDIPRFAATLMLVALIAAGSLAWLNEITKPRILAQQEKELSNGLLAVLPGVHAKGILPVTENGQILYYIGYKDADQSEFIGYALLSLAEGYQSTLRTLVGLDSTGNILAMKIIEQKETPGLGTRCQEVRSGETEPWWQMQFLGLNATAVSVDKDGGQIESITGATITSRALADKLAEDARQLIRHIQASPEE